MEVRDRDFEQYFSRNAAVFRMMYEGAESIGWSVDRWVDDVLFHASVASVRFTDGEHRYAMLERALFAFAADIASKRIDDDERRGNGKDDLAAADEP